MGCTSHRFWLWQGRLLCIGVLIVCVWLLVQPVAARADSPFTDPRFQAPQGGGVTASSPNAPAPRSSPVGWSALVPQMRAAPAPQPVPAPGLQAQTTNPMDPAFWTNQRAEGSKWISDNFIVGMSVVFQSGSSAMHLLSAVVAEAIFSTPPGLTTRGFVADGDSFGSPFNAAQVIANAATAIMVVLLAYRLVRLMLGYTREDAIELVVQFGGGLCLVWGSWYLCDIMITFANQVTGAVVGASFGTTPLLDVPPVTPGPGMSLVLALVTFFYYAMLVVLCFQAFRRIVLINLMLIVSPLLGLAITTGGAWNYGRVWFFRFVELLATPIIWAAALGFARALLGAWMSAAPGDEISRAVISSILAAFAYAMVLEAPRMVGLAAREAIGSSGMMRGMNSMAMMLGRLR